MKIAVFDVSHWHFPLYLSALRDPGVQVVGVSDTASFSGPKFADQLNCRLYESNEDLLNQDFDFALVFSRHSEMAGLAEGLIARGIPFLIEKPCGLRGGSSGPAVLGEERRLRQRSLHHARERPGCPSFALRGIYAGGVPASLIQVHRGPGRSI